jgi:hypothetical protein
MLFSNFTRKCSSNLLFWVDSLASIILPIWTDRCSSELKEHINTTTRGCRDNPTIAVRVGELPSHFQTKKFGSVARGLGERFL